MGGGNGAKSAQSRERNAKAAAAGGDKSQLKSNAAAQTIQCDICKQTFQGTSKQPVLAQHSDNKHSGKPFAACFPKFVIAA